MYANPNDVLLEAGDMTTPVASVVRFIHSRFSNMAERAFIQWAGRDGPWVSKNIGGRRPTERRANHVHVGKGAIDNDKQDVIVVGCACKAKVNAQAQQIEGASFILILLNIKLMKLGL